MFDITLDSGRVVTVTAINASDTYGGVLLGSPNAEMSASILEAAATAMERVWGPRPTYVINPAGMPMALLPERLPLEHWCAWLESGPLHNDNADGSQLVVVWFRDAADALALRDIITAGVHAVAWERFAADFQI